MSHYRRRLSLLVLASVLVLLVLYTNSREDFWTSNELVQGSTVETTALFHPDEGNGSSEPHLGWSATMCDPRSWLKRGKLRQYCQKYAHLNVPASPVYCERFLRPGMPPCGFYVGGVFRKPLKLLS
ncbi:uncharacterized protein TM35_000221440, partial [Trypanosoma theileri]